MEPDNLWSALPMHWVPDEPVTTHVMNVLHGGTAPQRGIPRRAGRPLGAGRDQELRPSVAYSCRQGFCGTGEVGSVRICVDRPDGDRLVVEET